MQAWENGMGDIGMIKGGLAWKLSCKGRSVIVDVVDHRGIIGLGVYPREEGEETVNIKQSLHHNALRGYKLCGVWPSVWLHVIGEGGIQPGMYSRFWTCVRQMTGGGMFHVQHARGLWQMNGPRIQIRWIFLSNFHVENIFIWVMDYFKWFFEV